MTSEQGKKWLLITLLMMWLVLMLTGCDVLRRPEEAGWQALHAVDVAQTMDIADDPCYYEANPFTRALIGANPNKAQVAAWGLGDAVLHALVSNFLLDHDMGRTYRVWQSLTIADSGGSVAHNIHIGIRIGAEDRINVHTAPGCRGK